PLERTGCGRGTPTHHPTAILVGKIERVCAEFVPTLHARRRRAGDVAVVVVTYDALPWIENCLASVAGYETVVVDNGSSDGTPAYVRERFPDVRLVQQENRGLGAGWNVGIR